MASDWLITGYIQVSPWYNPGVYLCVGAAVSTVISVFQPEPPSCQFSIPNDGQVYTLSGDYLTASVPLRVNSNCSGSASWSITFSCQTTGGHGPWTSGPYYRSGQINSDVNLDVPEGVGGKADATVTFNVQGLPPPPASVTFYVAGRQIPDNLITTRLINLYSQVPTQTRPRLFVGLASRESSYRQFEEITNYGKSARWPLEDEQYHGSHVGLTMVEPTLGRLFSWHTNTSYGVDFFAGAKRNICVSYVNTQRGSYPGLRDLTNAEYEMCTLVKYGPFAGQSTYYIPNQAGTEWIVDSSHSDAVGYADNVVSRMYEH